MKYYYAVMFGAQGKPHEPTYYRFETLTGRDHFVREPGYSGPAQEPEDAYYREIVAGTQRLRKMGWRMTRSGYAAAIKK
jgi:hypothetical protein